MSFERRQVNRGTSIKLEEGRKSSLIIADRNSSLIVVEKAPSEEYFDLADLTRSISVNIEIKRKESS